MSILPQEIRNYEKGKMSNLDFNFRIGRLHIQHTVLGKWQLTLNPYHSWFRWPIVARYE